MKVTVTVSTLGGRVICYTVERGWYDITYKENAINEIKAQPFFGQTTEQGG